MPVPPNTSPDPSVYKAPNVQSESDTSSRSVALTPVKVRERTTSVGEVMSPMDRPPMSERAKRAQRRASSGYEADTKVDIEPTRLAHDSKVVKTISKNGEALMKQYSKVKTRSQTQKRRRVDTSSSEDEPNMKSSLLRRRNVPKLLKKKVKFSAEAISKALKEMRAAGSDISPQFPTQSLPPTVENNIFARQASLSSLSPTLTPRPRLSNTTKLSNHISPTDTYFSYRKYKEVFSPEDEQIDQKGPLARFTRRLSAHAQSLADNNYDTPESDDSQKHPEHQHEVGDTSTLTATEATLQNMLEKLLGGILEKRKREYEQVTNENRSQEDHERIRNDSQRLATLIATQPPTVSAPARFGDERKEFYRIVEACLLYGAQLSEQMYQNIFRGGQLPTQEHLIKLVRDGARDVVASRDNWLIMQPQKRPDLFFSTKSKADTLWHRTLNIKFNHSDAFDLLRADEVRYRHAHEACDLQRRLGGKATRPEHSSYPLSDLLQRERAEIQRQKASSGSVVLYVKAHVADQSGVVQPIVPEQEQRPRQPSWKMDVDVKFEEQEPRAACNHTLDSSRGIHFASVDRAWKPAHGIHFAPLPEPSTAHISPQNVNMCAHFARGHCKFGNQCKKSHNSTAHNSTAHNSMAVSTHHRSISEKAQKVNGNLNELFTHLNELVHASPSELQYGDNVDRIARDIQIPENGLSRDNSYQQEGNNQWYNHVSNSSGGVKNKKGGKTGNNTYHNGNTGNRSGSNGTSVHNNRNGAAYGNKLPSTSNGKKNTRKNFNPTMVDIITALGSKNNYNNDGGHNGKKNRGQGRGKRGGRHGD